MIRSMVNLIKLYLLMVAFAVATSWSVQGAEKSNAENGLKLAEACQDCHGLNGVSGDSLFPNLAGQNDAYLINQLRNFRNEARDRAGTDYDEDYQRRLRAEMYKNLQLSKRSNVIMDYAVLTLSDQDIIDLAAHYSSMRCRLVAAGNVLKAPTVSIRCAICHGPKGIAKRRVFPHIAGQHRNYLRDQLVEFRVVGLEAKTGKKDLDRRKMMATQAASLSLNQIEELADYYASLPCR